MNSKRVVIVTGGSSGIGLATAQKFRDEDYQVIITGRNQAKLDEAKLLLGNLCYAVNADISELSSIPDFVNSCIEEYGRIDVLVNNAGINHKKPMFEVTDQEYQNIINVNQIGLFALTREVSKVMLNQDTKGNIVNISSMTAHYGLPKVIAYSASKTALEGMTRAMAVELSPLGIRVNCVAPGFIVTAMTSKAFESDPERKSRVLKRTPIGRMGEPEEIANAVYFLASDQASFITGEVLKVDGGNSIGF